MGPQSNAVNLARVISRDHGLTCKVCKWHTASPTAHSKRLCRSPTRSAWLGLDIVRFLVAAAHLANNCNIGRFATRIPNLDRQVSPGCDLCQRIGNGYRIPAARAVVYRSPPVLDRRFGHCLSRPGPLSRSPVYFQRTKRPAECVLQETASLVHG